MRSPQAASDRAGWHVVIDSITCAGSKSFGDSVRIQRLAESFASRLGTDTGDLRLAKRTQLPSAYEFAPNWSRLPIAALAASMILAQVAEHARPPARAKGCRPLP
jgi:hypothetical protein